MLTADSKVALIHKSSVNIINKDPKFSSPYFVFGEKVSPFSLSLSPSLSPPLIEGMKVYASSCSSKLVLYQQKP